MEGGRCAGGWSANQCGTHHLFLEGLREEPLCLRLDAPTPKSALLRAISQRHSMYLRNQRLSMTATVTEPTARGCGARRLDQAAAQRRAGRPTAAASPLRDRKRTRAPRHQAVCSLASSCHATIATMWPQRGLATAAPARRGDQERGALGRSGRLPSCSRFAKLVWQQEWVYSTIQLPVRTPTAMRGRHEIPIQLYCLCISLAGGHEGAQELIPKI